MSALKRTVTAVVIIGILAVLLELGLRAVVPAMIESGARMALRAPQSSAVEVSTQGSMLLNAVQWQIADVRVVADDVPLAQNLDAGATLDIGSMPLFPAFGSLRDGTATFEIPANELDGLAQFMSRGLAEWGELRDGQLVVGGVLTNDHFELPAGTEFEIPFETTIALQVEGDLVTVTTSDVMIEDQGRIGAFLTDALSEPQQVCIADRLPEGVTITEIVQNDVGNVEMRAVLSEGLLSSVSERVRGSCD